MDKGEHGLGRAGSLVVELLGPTTVVLRLAQLAHVGRQR